MWPLPQLLHLDSLATLSVMLILSILCGNKFQSFKKFFLGRVWLPDQSQLLSK